MNQAEEKSIVDLLPRYDNGWGFEKSFKTKSSSSPFRHNLRSSNNCERNSPYEKQKKKTPLLQPSCPSSIFLPAAVAVCVTSQLFNLVSLIEDYEGLDLVDLRDLIDLDDLSDLADFIDLID